MRYAIWIPMFLAVMSAGCLNENPMTVMDRAPDPIPPAPRMVPFEAHQENSIVPVGGDACTLELLFPGVIEGDHIGSGTTASSSVVNFCTGVQTADATITAANGDELVLAMVGSFNASDPENVSFWGDFTITGGSGRFESATGHGTYAGTADTIAGMGQFDLVGVISR